MRQPTKRRWISRIAIAAIAVSILTAIRAESPAAGTNAAATAQVSEADLPNFHKVTDGFYRGAQPSAKGFRQLEAMGIRTVISLRAFHSDRAMMAPTRMGYESIPMMTWHMETEDVVRFLRIVGDTNRVPVFVHCQHGADRTGLMSAMYRMFVCGWNRGRAVDEMINGGYGFHPFWTNIVVFAQNLDTNAIGRELQGFPSIHPQGD